MRADYFIVFLEGILTFISPCILPMLPIYLSYLGGNLTGDDQIGRYRLLRNAFGFVFGFTVIFVLLGALAGTLGVYVAQHMQILNVLMGTVLILFGLNYTGWLPIDFLNRSQKLEYQITKVQSIFSAILMGMIFGIGWTPCVGTFLGGALALAAGSGTVVQGIVMLTLYSIGLGIPFLLSAIFMGELKQAFVFIKKHYKIINLFSGILLILLGILMMFGWLGWILGVFSQWML